MHGGNHWGGSLEIVNSNSIAEGFADSNHNRSNNNNNNHSSSSTDDWDRAALHSQRFHHLDETQQSWLLGPKETKKKNRYVDLGCIVVSRKALKWTVASFLIAFLVIGLPVIIAKSLPKHKSALPSPDDYTLALHKALLFFNAQKCKSTSFPNSLAPPLVVSCMFDINYNLFPETKITIPVF